VKNAFPRVALPLLLLAYLSTVSGQTGVSADSTGCPGTPRADDPVVSGETRSDTIGWQVQCPLDTIDFDPCRGCCCSPSCSYASLSLERLGLLRSVSGRDRVIHSAAASVSASLLSLAVLTFLLVR